MRVLKDILNWLFPPHDVAEEARTRWANEQAMTRPVSPIELRVLLAKVNDNYQWANHCLMLWDVALSSGCTTDLAWKMIYDAIADTNRKSL